MSAPSGTEAPSQAATKRFICGVVEGFYGRPWTMEQRTELFKREQKWGLNTYLYAPKDDYKHRMYWRDLYTEEEAEQLAALISAAKRHDVEFIYAISPGLDMTFSNPREVATLKKKLDQVKALGCSSFSLLFDDIEAQMCPADQQAFSSLAHAQVDVTNQVYGHLGGPATFLFCPTDYCAAFCSPTVTQSTYLHTVGGTLLPGIHVLWTGPKVVSHQISVESIEEVSSVLQRAPVIWDNIHANDYDLQRLFLGPYKDRPTELIAKLSGVLTNPNCEFHPNFVAIHTLATWCRAGAEGGPRDVEMAGEQEAELCYSPQRALTLALSDWLEEFRGAGQPGGPVQKDPLDEEPMQTDTAGSPYVPGADENPLYTAEPLTLDDLTLLSDLFHLPYEHGPTARTMLQELDWLKSHSAAAAASADTEQAAEWRSRAQHFDGLCEAVVQMFHRLSNAPNRSILYDLYNYICDIKAGVALARTYVKGLGGPGPASAQLVNKDPEAWTFRGGLSGEFQRMLPSQGGRGLFRPPPTTEVYCIRPFCPEDELQVQRIFREVGGPEAPLEAKPPLLCDCMFDGETPPALECALVLEGETGVCGYAVALSDAKQAAARVQRAVDDAALEDFPTLMAAQVLPRVTDSPAKRMIGQLLSSIKSSGSKGVFCEVRKSDQRMLDLYTQLGCFRPITLDSLPQDLVAMGTSL